MLANLAGEPLIVRVYENLKPLHELGAHLVVATDAADIEVVCKDHGIPCVLTDPNHQSGTDRCFEVAQTTQHPFILNVQGDEPFINTTDLSALCAKFVARAAADLATLTFFHGDRADIDNPNLVKVVIDENDYALYFSRAAIPFLRDVARSAQPELAGFHQHIGVYAFRRQALARFCQISPSSLERIEKLEQLRALQHGMKILVAQASAVTLGIDTAHDLQRAEDILKQRGIS